MVTSKKNFVAVVTAPRTSAMLGLTTWTVQSQAAQRKAGLTGGGLGVSLTTNRRFWKYQTSIYLIFYISPLF